MNERPRLSVEITYEQRLRLSSCITQHGLQRAVFSKMIDNLCDMIEKYGEGVLACVLDDDLSVEELMKLLLKGKGA